MKYKLRSRNNEEIITTESNKTLNFFYDNILGRLLLFLLVNKLTSNIVAVYMNSKLSKFKIKKYINNKKINMDDYTVTKYNSFNDFFTRKIIDDRRPIDMNINSFISPCDSKLSVYSINPDLTLKIKDSYYVINTLVDKDILNEYIDGYALVFRLDVDDYHRYCYIDSGSKENNVKIKGIYHTVQPISLKHYNFYKTNSREYTVLNTNNFDKVIQVEIGAMCIGRINNYHEKYHFTKGEEKGRFEFGGSTIVLLVKKDTIKIDEDILKNSAMDVETIVKYGEKIGNKIN